MALFTRELHVLYKDLEITVRNHWFKGADLVIDGETKDHCDRVISTDSDKPLLSAMVKTKDGLEKIEAYLVAIATTKIKIHANGKFIAGENI